MEEWSYSFAYAQFLQSIVVNSQLHDLAALSLGRGENPLSCSQVRVFFDVGGTAFPQAVFFHGDRKGRQEVMNRMIARFFVRQRSLVQKYKVTIQKNLQEMIFWFYY
jgi:hypothetical protein